MKVVNVFVAFIMNDSGGIHFVSDFSKKEILSRYQLNRDYE